MATRQAEFRISIEKLEIKFKGTQELGQQIQQGVTHAIGGLMNAQARLLAAPPEPGRVIDAEVSDTEAPKTNGQGSPDANGEKPKQSRQRRAKGVSLVGLVRDLKQEGFFGQTRSVGDVLDRLKLKGHTVKRTTLSSRL